MTKSTTKKKMVSKSPNIASLVLPLLLIIFTLSSQVEHVESMGRKLAWGFNGAPIVYTPPSIACGASPAAIMASEWRPRRPCRRPPGTYIPASDQSP
uniref:Transmembrane protein n=3 Tax=Noccaea caerulescens TaxID=107243 RepID=A0A1J3HH84_NOCCA